MILHQPLLKNKKYWYISIDICDSGSGITWYILWYHPAQCINNVLGAYTHPISVLTLFDIKSCTWSLTTFTCTKYSSFCPYSEKDNIPTKLFTWLMKINIPLIFPLTCSRALWPNRWGTCSTNTASLFHSFNHLLEKVGVVICIFKNLLISTSFSNV